METKTVLSTSIWFHVSAWSADSSSRWAAGAARKGNYDGRVNISMVVFDADEIAEAIGDGRLTGADLVLRRDVAFGTAAVNVCMAPARITDSLGDQYMRRSQCLEMARRQLHRRYTVQGDTAEFAIPGATLREIKAGRVNAFLLYQETDGTDSYCRMSDNATLRLYVGDGWTEPVWTREISAGDTISGDTCSHEADLREIEYYTNLLRVFDGLTEMADIGNNLDVGAFAEWADVIQALQAGLDDCMEAEQRTIDWTVPETGMMPNADIVRQLRDAIMGDDMGKSHSDGYVAMQTFTPSWTPRYGQVIIEAAAGYKKSQIMNWQKLDPLTAGMEAVNGKAGGVLPTTGAINGYVCGWIFEQPTGGVIRTATVELRVMNADKENPRLTLYGIKVADMPNTASYSDVFLDEIVGEGNAVIGETTRFTLNARGVELLNSGEIYGVGLRYDNTKVDLAAQGRMILVLESIEETEPET